MAKEQALSFKLAAATNLTLESIDVAAKGHGLSRAGFVVRAIKFLAAFDGQLFDRLGNYRPSVTAGRVAAALLTKRLAEESAERKVWRMDRRTLEELTEGLTFAELFDVLERAHFEKEARVKAQILRRAIAQKNELGLPLTDDELTQELDDQRAAAAVRRTHRDTEAGARIVDGDDLFDATKWQVDKF